MAPNTMKLAAASAAPPDTPDQGRVGQRIAEQALHRRAARGQHGTDRECHEAARNAEIEDDVPAASHRPCRR